MSDTKGIQSTQDGETARVAVGSTDLLAALRASDPAEFVRIVRREKLTGRYDDLLRASGVAVHGNAGTSATRKLGNLCAALHGKRRNEYLAAFFDAANDEMRDR